VYAENRKLDPKIAIYITSDNRFSVLESQTFVVDERRRGV